MERGGVFYEKVERGVFFCKKVENGRCFFVKKWTFRQRRVHYVQYQYFLFYILLIRGVRTHPLPLPTGLKHKCA